MDFSGQAPSLSLSWVSQEIHAPPYHPPRQHDTNHAKDRVQEEL